MGEEFCGESNCDLDSTGLEYFLFVLLNVKLQGT